MTDRDGKATSRDHRFAAVERGLCGLLLGPPALCGRTERTQPDAMLGLGSMDAIKLLTQDHRAVERLFKAYERAGDRASKEKQRLADQVIRELSIHASIEEQFLYPTARELSDKLDSKVLEALEEHHLAKATLAELEKMSPSDERFDAKMTVLMENIRHHVEEEEEDSLSKAQATHGQRGPGGARGGHGSGKEVGAHASTSDGAGHPAREHRLRRAGEDSRLRQGPRSWHRAFRQKSL